MRRHWFLTQLRLLEDLQMLTLLQEMPYERRLHWQRQMVDDLPRNVSNIASERLRRDSERFRGRGSIRQDAAKEVSMSVTIRKFTLRELWIALLRKTTRETDEALFRARDLAIRAVELSDGGDPQAVIRELRELGDWVSGDSGDLG